MDGNVDITRSVNYDEGLVRFLELNYSSFGFPIYSFGHQGISKYLEVLMNFKGNHIYIFGKTTFTPLWF